MGFHSKHEWLMMTNPVFYRTMMLSHMNETTTTTTTSNPFGSNETHSLNGLMFEDRNMGMDMDSDSDASTSVYEDDDSYHHLDAHPRASASANKRQRKMSPLESLWVCDLGEHKGNRATGHDLMKEHFVKPVQTCHHRALDSMCASHPIKTSLVHSTIHIIRAHATGQIDDLQYKELLKELHDYRAGSLGDTLVTCIIHHHSADALFVGRLFGVIRAVSLSAAAAFLHALINVCHVDNFLKSVLLIKRLTKILLGLHTLPEIMQWVSHSAWEHHNHLQRVPIHRTIDTFLHAMLCHGMRCRKSVLSMVNGPTGFLKTIGGEAHMNVDRSHLCPKAWHSIVLFWNELRPTSNTITSKIPLAFLIALEHDIAKPQKCGDTSNDGHLAMLTRMIRDVCQQYEDKRQQFESIQAVKRVALESLTRYFGSAKLASEHFHRS